MSVVTVEEALGEGDQWKFVSPPNNYELMLNVLSSADYRRRCRPLINPGARIARENTLIHSKFKAALEHIQCQKDEF